MIYAWKTLLPILFRKYCIHSKGFPYVISSPKNAKTRRTRNFFSYFELTGMIYVYKPVFTILLKKYYIYSKKRSCNVIINHKYAKTRKIRFLFYLHSPVWYTRKKLCCQYFVESIVFILKQFHNAIFHIVNISFLYLRTLYLEIKYLYRPLRKIVGMIKKYS